MEISVMAELLIKLAILFAGIYVIIIATPKLAAFVDKRRKKGEEPETPRPERVGEDDNAEPGNSIDNEYNKK